MKILLLSDREEEYLWDYYEPGRLDGIDLMLSCGDLKPAYLEFLVTMGRAPLYYVHGNHDRIYQSRPPEGCECIDDRLVICKGLRILGAGGSMLYSGPPFQYTERQMQARLARRRRDIRRAGGVDILLTHAPAAGYGDAEDPAHHGFACFNSFMDRYSPAYLIHGHVHMNYSHNVPRITQRGSTTIVNAWGRYILEI